MNRMKKKRGFGFTFSYLDLFFLLFAGLILSYGIGSLVEMRRNARAESYQVYLTAPVGQHLEHALPVEGDVIFGEDGEPCGRVLMVNREKTEQEDVLTLKCRLDGEKPAVGDTLTVETPGCIRSMQVSAVETADTE